MKKIFSSLQTYLYFILFVFLFATLLVVEHQLSLDKIDNLQEQKNILLSLTKIDTNDKELALIEFNGKSSQLQQKIEKLKTLYKYNFTDKYIFGNEKEYLQSIDHLWQLIQKFNQNAQNYYMSIENKKRVPKNQEALKKSLNEALHYIDTMLLKSIDYNKKKFIFIKNSVIGIFLLVFLATLYYRKVLREVYSDIESLLQVDRVKKADDFFTQEADAISLRMKRKHTQQDNPELLDPVTGIYNHKGLLHSYAQKKDLKGSNFTAVTVLEIDNFSKSNRTFPQDVTQAILRKIAYTISLHELPVDVIARTDYNQFTLVFSRPSKEQAFKDVETIRQSIAELTFNIPNIGTTHVTVTGGFIIKPSNTSLEEALKKAKEILTYAKTMGKDRILQSRDILQREL
jgi:diguanylate cyclase (GGDEF)-like protein